MAAMRGTILNMTKGVVAPEIESRFDLSAYQAGLRTALNVKIMRTGGVAKRMGTRFVAEALSDTARLFPFQFSDTQAYALEFGQAYMRPLALGGAILEEGLAVTGITQAVNALVTSAFHGFEVGDQVYFIDIEGMTEINDRFLTILTTPTADTFTLDIDSTGFGAFTGSGGGTVRVAPPDPPPSPPTVPPEIVPEDPPHVGSGGNGGYAGGGWVGGGLEQY